MKFMTFGSAVIMMAMSTTLSYAAEGDVAAGKAVYKKCAACHFLNKEKARVGPHLVGIVGRKAGSVEGYKYSKGLKKMAEGGLVWDEGNLDKYLTKPRDFVKRGKMAFPGLKDPKDRADIIAYLKAEAKLP